jgi:hypothetical protein
MPCMEKKDLLGTRPQGCHSRVQSAMAWLEWVVGFIGGAKPWGRDWSQIICDHQMEQVNMPG